MEREGFFQFLFFVSCTNILRRGGGLCLLAYSRRGSQESGREVGRICIRMETVHNTDAPLNYALPRRVPAASRRARLARPARIPRRAAPRRAHAKSCHTM